MGVDKNTHMQAFDRFVLIFVKLDRKGCELAKWGLFGSTICYAFMQSVGMVNDHITTCFQYEELTR
ncbi:MAG: DNA-3-methyladenine glycosylase I [Kiritimatiellales bacterium]|nr:DNA-3-methyladenine glycosylase I [Kiritimatiellales bacterium]